MNSITLSGIQESSDFDDNRLIIYLTITYATGTFEGENVYENFDWFIRMPPSYGGSFNDYIIANEQAIYNDLAAKIQQWNDLDPKTREIPDPFGGEPTIVPITREEIVCPTYPDYYVNRAREYPTLGDQLDAYWKGGVDRDHMKATIDAIKAKYPKNV